jgi:hypothetical protein
MPAAIHRPIYATDHFNFRQPERLLMSEGRHAVQKKAGSLKRYTQDNVKDWLSTSYATALLGDWNNRYNKNIAEELLTIPLYYIGYAQIEFNTILY